MNVSQSLAALLRIEAQLDALKDTRARLRAAVDEEARRTFAETGAAPTYRVAGVGTASLSGADSWTSAVRDPLTFAGWALEHYPTEVEMVYRLAGNLPPQAFDLFAKAASGWGGVRRELEVRPVLIKKLSEAAPIISERAGASGDHPLLAAGGEIVPGVVMRRSEARLAIRFNADTRRELTARELQAARVLADLNGDPPEVDDDVDAHHDAEAPAFPGGD